MVSILSVQPVRFLVSTLDHPYFTERSALSPPPEGSRSTLAVMARPLPPTHFAVLPLRAVPSPKRRSVTSKTVGYLQTTRAPRRSLRWSRCPPPTSPPVFSYTIGCGQSTTSPGQRHCS